MLQEAGLAAAGLIAQIIVAKYCDHLPLYRQEQIYRTRHGVDISRQTMCRWLSLAAFWLRPLYESIRTGVLGGGYVQIDETPVKYLAPGEGKARQGYFWTMHRPGGESIYLWQTSRAAACLDALLPRDWSGIVQCDLYSAYPAFASRRGPDAPVVLAGCMAHLRRLFIEALPQARTVCGFILRQIQHLYTLEKQLRRSKAGPALRAAARGAHSRPVLERIYRCITRLLERRTHLPQSATGKALAYTRSVWPRLQLFLADGRVEIDSNLVENAIRPVALGRKNWLFIGDAAAGQTSAILLTIIASIRRRGLDPFAYLRDTLTKLPGLKASQLSEVTPAAWARTLRRAA